MRTIFGFLILVALFATVFGAQFDVRTVKKLTEIAHYEQSKLYNIEVSGDDLEFPVQLLDLVATSRYELGFAYGRLMGAAIETVYGSLIPTLFGPLCRQQGVPISDLEAAFDGMWELLEPSIPDEFMDELKGIHEGASVVGHRQTDIYIRRITVLADLPGKFMDWNRVWNMSSVFPNIFPSKSNNTHNKNIAFKSVKHSCSMWSAWGSRTQGGNVLAGRNLDWYADAGLQKGKLITIYHPPEEGKNVYTTYGYAGFWGAVAGISLGGLTVHEANLESSDVTLKGFAWPMRLRNILENANSLDDAKTLWNKGKNTAGFNHMFSSAKDKAATVLETNSENTAYFGADDPREQKLVIEGTNIGFPMKDGLYRTNHAYDATILKTFIDEDTFNSSSVQRYYAGYETLSDYEKAEKLMTGFEAVNMTFNMADKPVQYSCDLSSKSTNVLSVAWAFDEGKSWSSWEEGTCGGWKPACCAPYVEVNIVDWMKGKLN